jgi:transposase
MFIIETMERKQPRRRRSFTPEFKAEIVERCRAGDRTIGQVARDFDLAETAVRAWVAQAETDAGDRPGLTSDERAELARLRRENRSLREDVDVLKRRRLSSRRRPGEGASFHRGGESRRPRRCPCVPPA